MAVLRGADSEMEKEMRICWDVVFFNKILE